MALKFLSGWHSQYRYPEYAKHKGFGCFWLDYNLWETLYPFGTPVDVKAHNRDFFKLTASQRSKYKHAVIDLQDILMTALESVLPKHYEICDILDNPLNYPPTVGMFS